MAGFSRYGISLTAYPEVPEEKLKHGSKRVTNLQDDPDAPRAAFV
ncbi:hypothetical protein Z949_1092 [Sulfitobacter guttiformis KCTC 32187]|nr:hypothetical protein Z949_1092 [Sulfitobacter guttiformis KCTC 32187]